MKKTLIFLILVAIMLFLVGCGGKGDTTDVNDDTPGVNDDTPVEHFHSGGTNTCLNGAICTACGTEYGTALGHDFTGDYLTDSDGHWHVCANGCGTADTKVEHTGGTADCESPATCTACGTEYGTALGHDFTGDYLTDSEGHWHVCANGCGTTDTKVEHTGGTATLTEKARCDACGTEYGERLSLTWAITPTMPTNGGTAILANNYLRTFANEYNYLTTDTQPYATGADYYMPLDCMLKWTVGEPALYYRIYISENVDMSGATTLVTNECHVNVANLYTGCHYFWRVDAVYGTYTVRSTVFDFTTEASPRAMSVDGVSNVRDIGGYINEDGLRIKQGMVYRSAKLDNVTDLGMYTLLYIMGINTDLDLRAEKDATRPLGEGVGYVNAACPWYSTGENGIWASDTTKAEFAKAIKVFAYEENYPIIFHCALGRDRTGTLALVLEGLLGLDVNTLLMEYELSAFSSQGTLGSTSYAGLRANILATYNYIDNNYSGERFSDKVESFLLEIGVTQTEIDSIRAIMLEEVK